jgi:hypothetical protein
MPQTRQQRASNAQKAPATPSPSNRQRRQQTPTSGVSTGSSSSKGYNSKLDFLWKELCEDIEANGGIRKFSDPHHKYLGNFLDKLIQKDPKKRELYHLPHTPRRQQIRKKIWDWGQLLIAKTYKNVLSRYGVKEFKYRRTTSSDLTIPSESETSADWTLIFFIVPHIFCLAQ